MGCMISHVLNIAHLAILKPLGLPSRLNLDAEGSYFNKEDADAKIWLHQTSSRGKACLVARAQA